MSTNLKTEGAKYQPGARPLLDIIHDLSGQIPERLLKEKTLGGRKIKYLAWYKAVRFLDLYAPGWTYEIRNVTGIGGKLVLVARITIQCQEGYVWREATGQESEEVNSFGDSSSNAESMALRRAAAKFGLGLYLYEDNKH